MAVSRLNVAMQACLKHLLDASAKTASMHSCLHVFYLLPKVQQPTFLQARACTGNAHVSPVSLAKHPTGGEGKCQGL